MNDITTLLDDFGEEFVLHIRDFTVTYCRQIIANPNQKAKLDQLVQKTISSYKDEHKDILIEQLVPLIVDLAFANFFWFLQQEWFRPCLPLPSP